MKDPLQFQPTTIRCGKESYEILHETYTQVSQNFIDIRFRENKDFQLKSLLPTELGIQIDDFISQTGNDHFGGLIIKNFIPEVDFHRDKPFASFLLYLLQSALNSSPFYFIEKGLMTLKSMGKFSEPPGRDSVNYYYPLLNPKSNFSTTVFYNFNYIPCDLFSLNSITWSKMKELERQLRKPIFNAGPLSIAYDEYGNEKKLKELFIPVIYGPKLQPSLRIEFLNPFMEQKGEAKIAIERLRSLIENNLCSKFVNKGDVLITKNKTCFHLIYEFQRASDFDWFFSLQPESNNRLDYFGDQENVQLIKPLVKN